MAGILDRIKGLFGGNGDQAETTEGETAGAGTMDKVKDVAEKVPPQVKETSAKVVEKTKETGGKVAEAAKETGGKVAGVAKETTGKITGKVKGEGADEAPAADGSADTAD